MFPVVFDPANYHDQFSEILDCAFGIQPLDHLQLETVLSVKASSAEDQAQVAPRKPHELIQSRKLNHVELKGSSEIEWKAFFISIHQLTLLLYNYVLTS